MIFCKELPVLIIVLSTIKKNIFAQECDQEINVNSGSSGIINSPNYPNQYLPLSDCTYKLIASSASDHITLTFNVFDLEVHGVCSFDYVAVYDGPSTSSSLIDQRFCGSTIPPKISGTGQYLTIHFASDASVNALGFSIFYEVGCTFEFSQTYGEIRSPNYPFAYPPTSACTYKIFPLTGSQLLLNFKFFDLEDSTDCTFDYLKLSASNMEMDRYCGFKQPFSKLFNVSRLTLSFNSDRSVNRNGFYVEYNVTSSCGINKGGCDQRCVDLKPGQILCACHPGYQLDDSHVKCVDINECVGTSNPCSDRCTNLIGSYRCSCDTPGFSLAPDNKTCSDMTCKVDNGGCDHLCQPFGNAQYHCACHRGYILHDDQHSCIDVNECNATATTYKHHCEQICMNEPGSYYCLCQDGYTLSSNGRTCDDLDECPSVEHVCGHLCENVPGGWQCSCHEGYKTDPVDSTDCIDVDECVEGLAPSSCSSCTNLPGSYLCTCMAGYIGNSESTNCTDINECDTDNGNCKQLCLNTPGSYKCGCQVGYEPTTLAATICVDINECASNSGRGPCDHFCRNLEGGFECVCASGYTLLNDGMSCQDNDECEGEEDKVVDKKCEQQCVNTNGAYHCECYPGYTEVNGTCIDVDECLLNPCDASFNSTCANTIGSFTCTCPAGYTAVNTTVCMDNDECAGSSHGCQQLCVNTPGTYNCECEPGYFASGKECLDVNECNDKGKCQQLCYNLVGSYRCDCNSGYYLLGDNTNCSDINECSEGIDNCQQVCVNEVGYHRCTCHPGYVLNNDNITCTDIDECNQGTSGCSNWCTNIPGSYICHCDSGYELKSDNRTCQDIDECASNNGGCDHICTNSNGSFSCGCMAGYTFNGIFSCSDINECATSNGNCSQACNNTDGSYECLCEDNFKLESDKITCSHCPSCTDFEQVKMDIQRLLSIEMTVAQLTQNNLQLSARVALLEDRVTALEGASGK